jgi:putative ABC transport system substrate-binding protein
MGPLSLPDVEPRQLHCRIGMLGAVMRRRDFIGLLGGAAALPFALRAQSNGTRRIGVLITTSADDREGQRRLRAFREGLQSRGWLEGKNVRLEIYWSVSNTERAEATVKEIMVLGPDLILTSGTPGTAAAHRATSTIPVVFTGISEPIEQGFVQSLAHPGGNITGLANLEPSLGGKWVELLKEIAPNVTRIAIIFNPQTAPAILVASGAADEA